MVIYAGKSRKNMEAYALLLQAVRKTIDFFIDARSKVGEPASNTYVFGAVAEWLTSRFLDL